MAETKKTRRYELRRRADAMEATRRRITEAVIELHGSVGPARTTIARIAELAGVQRHTVYRHFPTEEELFTACSTEYWNRHPWPRVAAWEEIDSPEERFTTALTDLYDYYTTVERMLTNVLRDADRVPLAERSLQTYEGYLNEVALVLTAAYALDTAGADFVKAAIRHATAFCTWRSLVRRQGLEPADAVALMGGMVAANIGRAQHRHGPG